MLPHDLATAVLVYLSFRALPERMRPAIIVREPADDDVERRSLVVVDPSATRQQVVERLNDLLDPAERAAYRAAYHLPSVGEPMTDDQSAFMLDGPCLLFVPAMLRLHGEPPIQGGRVADERRARGELRTELAMLNQEWALLRGRFVNRVTAQVRRFDD